MQEKGSKKQEESATRQKFRNLLDMAGDNNALVEEIIAQIKALGIKISPRLQEKMFYALQRSDLTPDVEMDHDFDVDFDFTSDKDAAKILAAKENDELLLEIFGEAIDMSQEFLGSVIGALSIEEEESQGKDASELVKINLGHDDLTDELESKEVDIEEDLSNEEERQLSTNAQILQDSLKQIKEQKQLDNAAREEKSASIFNGPFSSKGFGDSLGVDMGGKKEGQEEGQGQEVDNGKLGCLTAQIGSSGHSASMDQDLLSKLQNKNQDQGMSL